jgi:hypothetical protein
MHQRHAHGDPGRAPRDAERRDHKEDRGHQERLVEARDGEDVADAGAAESLVSLGRETLLYRPVPRRHPGADGAVP